MHVGWTLYRSLPSISVASRVSYNRAVTSIHTILMPLFAHSRFCLSSELFLTRRFPFVFSFSIDLLICFCPRFSYVSFHPEKVTYIRWKWKKAPYSLAYGREWYAAYRAGGLGWGFRRRPITCTIIRVPCNTHAVESHEKLRKRRRKWYQGSDAITG